MFVLEKNSLMMGRINFYHLCFLFSFLFCSSAVLGVEGATSTRVIALFSKENWYAGLNIPLRVTGKDLSLGLPVKAELIDGSLSKSECKIMRDLYIGENFLLRCLREGSISVKLTLNPATTTNPYPQSEVLLFGPLIIKKMNGLKFSNLPSVGAQTGGSSVGSMLFNSYCMSCHQTKSLYLMSYPISSDRIWSAITSGPAEMSGLRNQLERTQVDEISKFLQSSD